MINSSDLIHLSTSKEVNQPDFDQCWQTENTTPPGNGTLNLRPHRPAPVAKQSCSFSIRRLSIFLYTFTSILSNLCNFHSLEVVDRVNETQLQVGENSN